MHFLMLLLGFLFIAAAIGSLFFRKIERFRFTFLASAFALFAFIFPSSFISWGDFQLKSFIGPMVQIILLGMGTTLTIKDLVRVFHKPKLILIGIGLQYMIMPLSGFAFAGIFQLPDEIAVGLVLIGSCPGGVSSNVIAYLSKANVALSISVTAVSTLLSPFLTPIAMKLLSGSFVNIEFSAMFFSILKLVLLPLILGITLNGIFPKFSTQIKRVLPSVAMLCICLIIAITIALSIDDILEIGVTIFFAILCQNAGGYLLGYYCTRFLGYSKIEARTISIEVGIQNGGMATGIAFEVLESVRAALGSAIYGPWSAFVGSILASFWGKANKT
ncbi:bile acid:sodium symporter family protein [Membranihabitans maritimus]|uniref:bile acid:sodium symporter family protein n=1 Tax=Membranihabitans maritimus TaxID=2904244 RepID=UPI001F4921C1|nr:bile acid:sodium symporter family protein [Membranihabitans maritimus]